MKVRYTLHSHLNHLYMTKPINKLIEGLDFIGDQDGHLIFTSDDTFEVKLDHHLWVIDPRITYQKKKLIFRKRWKKWVWFPILDGDYVKYVKVKFFDGSYLSPSFAGLPICCVKQVKRVASGEKSKNINEWRMCEGFSCNYISPIAYTTKTELMDRLPYTVNEIRREDVIRATKHHQSRKHFNTLTNKRFLSLRLEPGELIEIEKVRNNEKA